VEREVDFEAPIVSERDATALPFVLPAEYSTEVVRGRSGTMIGRIARRTQLVSGATRIASRREDRFVVVRIVVENHTRHEDPTLDRDRALSVSLLGAHVVLEVDGGEFVSLLDPPGAARELVERCENVGAFPVLIGRDGDRSTVLASPIVLY